MTQSNAADRTEIVSAGGTLPTHVAVIMDGNGRWAEQRGMPRIAGHRKGAEAVRRLIQVCGKNGISYLTLFAFSSENWNRPESEVKRLMDLFVTAIDKNLNELHTNEVRFRIIGNRTALSDEINKKINYAEVLTAENNRLYLTVALNYGGRWDIVEACRKLTSAALMGEVDLKTLTPGDFESALSTSGLPEPDLFIRTGGEHRISNFLLWQLAYTELFFTDVLWPDFNEKQFAIALESFSNRQRRFGKTGDQLKVN